MKLTYRDYNILIQRSVDEMHPWAQDTSLPYDVLKSQCQRTIEILDACKADFPTEYRTKGMGEGG